jgi:ribosomal protein S12 methylthiotransferase accessory factor
MKTSHTQPLEPSGIYSLVEPLGGLFSKDIRFRAFSDEPSLITRVMQSGDIGQVWSHVGNQHGHRLRAGVNGAGSGLTDSDAYVPALGEGLERYSTCVFTPEQFITATADELGREALDLDAIPCCSATELANPNCPVTAPKKSAPIRWVRGLSLMDGRDVYIPAVMTFLFAGFISRDERLCLPITTGCAGHVTYERAVLSGIFEVIERDAISLTWLQKLALPRIEVDCITPELSPYWERYQRSSKALEYHFFDATTELGIPTIYGLQVSRVDKHFTTLVSCSTAATSIEALTKVIRDMAASRIAFRQPRKIPDNFEEFTDLFHGATYMARSEQAHAFDFLTKTAVSKPLSGMPTLPPGDDKQQLLGVLECLCQRKMEAFVVDLSTDEALRSGVRIVRVFIPALQPLSFNYRARYLGHPRLYDAPRQMGYPVHQEEQLNQWPQPFS